MKRSILAVLVFVLFALGAGAPAWAHHSFTAVFDTTNPVTVKGVITQVRLENPHSWFVVDVKDSKTGNVDRWSFEAGTPSGMLRNGYRPGVIKAGDQVTIKGFQSKDSDVRGMLRELVTAYGHVYGLFRPQENR